MLSLKLVSQSFYTIGGGWGFQISKDIPKKKSIINKKLTHKSMKEKRRSLAMDFLDISPRQENRLNFSHS